MDAHHIINGAMRGARYFQRRPQFRAGILV
jgi:hypothetical protein